ncbi:MAG: HEPN domain-containing protein [Anaerolineae bacterium]|nr:HEPN domain-containing protein [Anaerolineae bacterium]
MLKDLKISVPNINERDHIPSEAIQAIVDHIVQTFEPEQIVLFGSYAVGQPTPGSDVDLLIVLETENSKKAQLDVALSFRAPFGLDILVLAPQEIRERVRNGDTFLHHIITNGKTLYQQIGKFDLQDIPMRNPDPQRDNYVQEWIQKAEGDFLAATSLFNLQQAGVTDAICFHAQQCAEKYAKAYLVRQAIAFQRTHDLIELLQLCCQTDSEFATITREMQALNSYSVETRYPGRISTFEEAEGAVDVIESVRQFMRSKLQLEDETGVDES